MYDEWDGDEAGDTIILIESILVLLYFLSLWLIG